MKLIPKHAVELRSRTWKKLLAIDRSIRERFPNRVSPGLEILGLRITPVPHVESYHSSPVNALSFAHNGAEAVFSLLLLAEQVTDESPVLLTCVGASEQHNFIVGKSLHEFLCLGYHRGFFALEQMGYDSKRTLKLLTSARWKPQSETDWLLGFGVNDEQQPVLEHFRKALKLRPWRDSQRKFARLQRYLLLLELRTSLFAKDWEDEEFRAWGMWLNLEV
jgi:hypothetical protein